MSAAATSHPSAGWYPDPKGGTGLRWWDGARWTEHVTALPAPPEPEAEAAPAPEPEAEPDPAPEPEADPTPEPLTAAGAAFRAALREARQASRPEPEFVAGVAEAEPDAPPVVPAPDPEPEAEAEAEPAPEAEPVPEPEPEPDPAPAAAAPAPAPPVEHDTAPAPAPPVEHDTAPGRAPRLRRGLLVVAAVAAGGVAFTLLNGNDPSSDSRDAAPRAATVAPADRACLVEWNTTATPEAAQLRVTLGQFARAHAWIGRVAPLPATRMGPNSCALTVYDEATDTSARFVSGVADRVGYMDVTTYPRAARIAVPRSERAANIRIQPDGTVRAITRR